MPLTTGRVNCVSVDDSLDYFFFQVIEDETGQTEIFVIWFGTDDLSAPTQIRNRMWMSMVREALATGRQLAISHTDSDSAVQGIRENRTP